MTKKIDEGLIIVVFDWCFVKIIAKMRKIIFVLIALLIIGGIGYKYVYKDHRDIAAEEVTFKLTSNELIAELVTDNDAVTKYLDRVISVSGVVSDANEDNLTLSNDIFCTFDSVVKDVSVGDSMIVKGRCLGFDELLMQVKLDQCQIINWWKKSWSFYLL